jgi:hypothetical protein
MVEYSSAAIYVNSCTTDRARIVAIDAIIDQLMTTGLEAAANGDLSEYYMDSGQTKITCKYRNATEVLAAIQAFEGMKNVYIGRLNGRMVRMVPEQNFRNGRRC